MLNEIMKEKKLTNKQLAEMIEVGEDTIIRAKRDIFKIKFDTIRKLCIALNISPFDLAPNYFLSSIFFNECKKMIDYSFAELPEFTQDEKKYLSDMMNGTLYNPDVNPITHLKLNVLDSNKYDGLGAKWNVDVNKLYDKVDNLTAHQAYTIIYKIREWWATVPDTQKDINNIF